MLNIFVSHPPFFLIISQIKIRGIAVQESVSEGERAWSLEILVFQEERTREPSGNSLAGEIDHVFLEQ